jgi:hypothetical protein
VAAATTIAALGACGKSPPPRSAAHTLLYEQLDRPAGLHAEGDTAFIVTEMETHPRPLSAAERETAARAIGRTVVQYWPDPRLVRVRVVFKRATRLGPFIVRTIEHPVEVDLRSLPAAPAS